MLHENVRPHVGQRMVLALRELQLTPFLIRRILPIYLPLTTTFSGILITS